MKKNNVSTNSSLLWVIVPAAGVGTRMGAALPKQYLPLLDKTVIEHSLERLISLPNVQSVFLALAPADNYWNNLPLAKEPRIQLVVGGDRRCDSVQNALNLIVQQAAPDDWVLVHDAARPCVRTKDIMRLLEKISDHNVGGILGVPVSDTLKQTTIHQSDELVIESTQDRNQLWRAQTPQIFRVQLLHKCLTRALREDKIITDESSAVEAYGYQPLMVEGHEDNIKITRAEDLPIAEMLLRQQL